MNAQNSGFAPSRRTLVKGAAWSVPVVAVGAKAASAAASCEPDFTALPGSIKCCKGNTNSMKLIIQITDQNNCINATDKICVDAVYPSNGGTVARTTFYPSACVNEGESVTVYLYDVSNCTVNLTVKYRIGNGEAQYAYLKSNNISDGTQCLDPNGPAALDSTQTSDTAGSSDVEVEQAPQNVTTVEEPVTEVQGGESAPVTDGSDTAGTGESADTSGSNSGADNANQTSAP